MSESIYCVYKHTSPSGKSYIGQTNNYERRCYQHQKKVKNTAIFYAIKKYGWDNFTHEILKDNLTLEQANYWEEKLIKEHNTLSPNGYNLVEGGINRKHSEELKKKSSISYKLWILSNPEKHNEIRKKAANTLRSDYHRKRVGVFFAKWAIENPDLNKKRIEKRTKTFNLKENRQNNSIKGKEWILNNPQKAIERQNKATIAKNKPEAIDANRQRALNQWSSPENRKRMSDIKKEYYLNNPITWIIRKPNGDFVSTKNLKEFCIINGLSYKSMTDSKHNKSKGFVRIWRVSNAKV